MDLDRVTYWRDVAGKAGAAFCAIFLLAAVDGLVSGYRESDDVVRLLAGESVKVNGSLRENVGSVADLRYDASSDFLHLTFEAVHSGFWLGGFMWRGLLTVSPDAQAGEYSLKVAAANGDPAKPSRLFLVRVYPDYASYRKSDKSLMRKYLDVSPWWVLGTFFSLTCLCFVAVYLFSQKRGVLLAQEGMAEVYLVEKGEEGYRISFGLGTGNGVQSGMELTVFDQNGIALGNATVEQASATDSVALVKSDSEVTMSCTVSLRRG